MAAWLTALFWTVVCLTVDLHRSGTVRSADSTVMQFKVAGATTRRALGIEVTDQALVNNRLDLTEFSKREEVAYNSAVPARTETGARSAARMRVECMFSDMI